MRQRCDLVEHGTAMTPKHHRVGSKDPAQELGQLGRDVKAIRVLLERIAGRIGEEPEGNVRRRKRVVESEADSEESADDEEKVEGELEGLTDENSGDSTAGSEAMDVEL